MRGQPPCPVIAPDGALVSAVDLGSFVPVDLHGDKPIVDDGRHFLVLVALPVHNVAPVAPHGADVQEHGLPLLGGQAEGLVTPRMPLDRLVGCALQSMRWSLGRGGWWSWRLVTVSEFGSYLCNGSFSMRISPSSRASIVIRLPHSKFIPTIAVPWDSTTTTSRGSSCQLALPKYMFITETSPSANVNLRCPIGLSCRLRIVGMGSDTSPLKPVSRTAATGIERPNPSKTSNRIIGVISAVTRPLIMDCRPG